MIKNDLYFANYEGNTAYASQAENVVIPLVFTMPFRCNTIRILNIDYYATLQGVTKYIPENVVFTFVTNFPYNMPNTNNPIINTTFKNCDLLINIDNTSVPNSSILEINGIMSSGNSFDASGVAYINATLIFNLIN